MAKKISIVSLALGLFLAAMSFANGQREAGIPTVSGQPGSPSSGQKLVITGSVAFQNLIHPTLKSGDKLYELLVPRFLVYRAGLKEGAQVTVEGYQVSGMPPWDLGDDNNVDVLVTKATINGKDYDLSQFRGPAGGYGYRYGRGPGMMEEWGPGYGAGMMGGYRLGEGPGWRGGWGPGCGF